MGTLGESFKNAYEKAYNENLQKIKLKIEIKEIEEYISIVNFCMSKNLQSKASYPIIVGNILTRALITNIGKFSPYKYTDKCIYPLKYTVKKRYGPHKNYKKSMQNKVLYICTVNNDGISITSDDGYTWSGNNVWKDFCDDVGITDEFVNIEEFMALTHPTIVKLVEEIGDISGFEGYVSLNNRPKKIEK
jgi:hypothetical protein